ncbi:MAG: HD domain-containing protein [Bacteroidales bacterium]|nr:HD domain-containing protein [Bacteroidales bacterium]
MTDKSFFQALEKDKRQQVVAFFEDYAQSYLANPDPEYHEHIRLKYEHIHRVRDEISMLGKSLGMDEGQLAFADMLAVLHDIGRFEQFDKYRTFADAESENHSLIAWRIVEGSVIRKVFPDAQAEILRRAILNHNLPAVPESADEPERFYSCLIRDADKLDIWRVSLEYSIFHRIHKEEFPSGYQVPAALMRHFSEERIIKLTEVGSYYDSILFRVSWVYDLNFRHTYNQFAARRIAEQLLQKIPASNELNVIREQVERFTFRKINSGD